MALSIETCAAQHIGDREEQQDRVSLFPHPTRKGMLMAVLADGMGGHTGGAMAAEQVVFRAKQGFEVFAPADETPQQLLGDIIKEAHIAIKLTRFTSEQDPHSTACVLLFQPGRVDWAHCGDSRIYHFRNDRLVGRSSDHSYVNMMLKQGYLTPEQAERHPQKNVLLGCLGAEREPTIDHGEAVPPRGGDIFLLCSDGLWAYFSDAELGGVLAAHPPRAAAELLIQRARDRAQGHGDNCSLAIVKLTEKAEEKKPAPAGSRPAKA
ncbi:MAG: Protein phosphatase PhpP [Rhodocyclaceae bacterium]|nr:serine/threonine-protein phosphatase [Zoogloeaceae bacterium]MBV6407305.1 Protein phosphatase PhpP [Rhodocyclaceae bacterium]MCK6383856.1 protein phosphatase 2C domain-containing protein [Rhodocyclaceae bacterium]CAG0943975.1 PPM family protein phosphatase [Gammaproteobacteria bacterium]